MSIMNRVLIGLYMLMASACAAVPFESTELTLTRPFTAAELSGKRWNSGTGSLIIRQSALFELEGMRVPIMGIMKLDLTAKTARLIGMNDMGVKLYDISVDAASSTANFIIPDLAAYPGFSEAVALSVRRIFLTPEPGADDKFERTPKQYLLTRDDTSGGKIRFTFGGVEAQLLEKSFRGTAESWLARYYQYQRRNGHIFPGGIVLDDERAGYRLTLWIESVEKTDE